METITRRLQVVGLAPRISFFGSGIEGLFGFRFHVAV
jgi:hypothetical protein